MLRDYQVVAVDDADLPEDHDWAFYEDALGAVFIVRKSRTMDVETLAEAWAAQRRVALTRKPWEPRLQSVS